MSKPKKLYETKAQRAAHQLAPIRVVRSVDEALGLWGIP